MEANMITLIQGNSAPLHRDLFDQMFRLRARVFSERLGWDVNVHNGRERDAFDDLDPLYGLALSKDGGRVLGCFRLLQTTGPNMLSSVFRKLLPPDQTIRSPIIWETTRFCVDTAASEGTCETGLNNLTGRLLAGVYEVGHLAGLSHIVAVVDVRMERVMRRAGCPMQRLAPPQKFGKVDAVATLVPTTRDAVVQILDRNRIPASGVDREQMRDCMRAAM